MKKIFSWFMQTFIVVLTAIAVFGPAAFSLQRFEDDNLSVVTKLPPQYLGYKIVAGTTTAGTEYKYYKITAVVTGLGETRASPVLTVPLYDAGMTSTNSIRIMWAPVNGATSYNLYKSVDATSFYLLTNSVLLTYVDEGETLGSAFSAASPRGGNITAETSLGVYNPKNSSLTCRFLGAFTTLPTSGAYECDFAYQTSDKIMYLATMTVTAAGSWKAIADGATGATGAVGATGATGAKGATGAVGATGATGGTGA
jgi:hypothetical protein